MRKRLPLVILALVILPAMATYSYAQDGCIRPTLTAQYTGGEMHLQLALINENGFYTTNCWTGVTGVDVYRQVVGNTCGADVLITDQPLAWNNSATQGQPFVSADIVDDGVEPNRAYKYIARVVGSPGNDDAVFGFASTGPSFICSGFLNMGPDCGFSSLAWVNACYTDCFGYAILGAYTSEAASYFNTNVTLYIYGEFNGVIGGICNTEVPVLNITDVAEGQCVIATESTTWGAVKVMYR